jgi:hypothetical protein
MSNNYAAAQCVIGSYALWQNEERRAKVPGDERRLGLTRTAPENLQSNCRYIIVITDAKRRCERALES